MLTMTGITGWKETSRCSWCERFAGMELELLWGVNMGEKACGANNQRNRD